MQTRIALRGLHCSACAARVRAALLDLPGVSAAAVTLPMRVAVVWLDPRRVSEQQVLAAIAHASAQTRHEYHGIALR